MYLIVPVKCPFTNLINFNSRNRMKISARGNNILHHSVCERGCRMSDVEYIRGLKAKGGGGVN